MTICERMFGIIDERGIKDIELSRYLKKTNSTISNWRIRGSNPPSELIIPICDFLGISIHYLLTGEEAPDLPEEEQELIKAFRSADDGIKSSVKKLLDIPEKRKLSNSEQETKIS